jgi:ribosome-binding factor A
MSSRRTDRPRGRSGERSVNNQHKLEQLCAQVERALVLTLAGDCQNPILNNLDVYDVTPAPDASRLLVRVCCRFASLDELAAAYDALTRAKGLMRSAVAAELNRKRTPELSFVVIAPEQGEG